jgi:hypothetical protein
MFSERIQKQLLPIGGIFVAVSGLNKTWLELAALRQSNPFWDMVARLLEQQKLRCISPCLDPGSRLSLKLLCTRQDGAMGQPIGQGLEGELQKEPLSELLHRGKPFGVLAAATLSLMKKGTTLQFNPSCGRIIVSRRLFPIGNVTVKLFSLTQDGP